MRTLPAGMLALLKSRSMLGLKKPRYQITVSDGVNIRTPDNISSVRVRRDVSMMAAEARVVIGNTAGRYTPDAAGDWYRMFWPNSILTINQGYGTDMVRTFTGLIDDVTISHAPALITTKARDYAKFLLDFTITDPVSGEHTALFPEQEVADTVATLAEWAGFAPGDITTETTGLVMPPLSWDLRTYADILTGLCELTGFEVLITDEGKFVFQRASDRQPENVHTAALHGTTWEDLPDPFIVAGSERVRHTSGTPTYLKNTDYEVEYGPAARVRRMVGGSIGDGETVDIAYVYPAYTFRAGEDLRKIEYMVSDKDLYHSSIIEGEDADRNPIIGVSLFGAPLTYRLSEQKVLFTPAPEARTQAQCDLIAGRMTTRMVGRARRVEVATIAVPWLQVGDCVRVLESTTTISEIYRITAIDLIQDKDGFVSILEMYYYGYTPPEA